MFRTVPLSIVRSFSLYSQQRYMSAKLYDIYLCCVYSEKLLMMDRNCPKHVEFYSTNKFEKLMHLVGFIIRLYNDARSPEQRHTPRICSSEFTRTFIANIDCVCLTVCVSVCLSYPDNFYLLTVAVKGYCCTWSHSMAHTHKHIKLHWTPLNEGSARQDTFN